MENTKTKLFYLRILIVRNATTFFCTKKFMLERKYLKYTTRKFKCIKKNPYQKRFYKVYWYKKYNSSSKSVSKQNSGLSVL